MDEMNKEWYIKEDEEELRSEYSFIEYDIISSPNDFNIRTLFDFIEEGKIEIPNFQRNYVWDIKRASKLIESVIMGLPIPQIFLYEKTKNNFLVIDGQQRLMTIYYFKKQRFPKKEYRVFIGREFDKEKRIPDKILKDDKYFDNFNLNLPDRSINDKVNPLNGLNYSTLNNANPEWQEAFDIRTIRCIIIKQYHPPDDSAIYEIFSRLNSGGMNLTPQEIRLSLYHSDFYNLLDKLNQNEKWRKIIGIKEEDIHLKDIEIILRAFALLIKGYNNETKEYDNYFPSMNKFLNTFSKEMKGSSTDDLNYYDNLFNAFLGRCDNLPKKPFHSKGKFNISMFEAIFVAVCEKAFLDRNLNVHNIEREKLDLLKNDDKFKKASFGATTSKNNVIDRIKIAKEILLS